MSEYVARQVETRATQFPELWNTVEFEHFVSPEDTPAVMTGCLTGVGVTSALYGADGSFTTGNSAIGEFEFAAIDACTLSFPPDYQKPYVQTDAQLRYLYSYDTTFLMPCLRAAGYAPESPPTLEEFIDSAFGSMWVWSPYSTFNFASDRRWSNYPFNSPELVIGLEQLNDRCPPYPEGMEPEF